MEKVSEYPIACDYIRKELGEVNTISLYDLVVKFTNKYIELKEGKSSQQEKKDDRPTVKRKTGRPRKSS